MARSLFMCGFRLAGVFAVLSLGLAWPVWSAQPNWPNGPYRYTVVNQDLRSVLERFGENMGVKLVISDAVKGTVQGTPANTSPIDFLDQLCHAYGLEWYYDGTVLAITTIAERQQEAIDLRGIPFATAQARLRADGLLDPRFTFKQGVTPGSAVVSGPPRYIADIAHQFGASDPEVATSESQLIIHEGDQVTIYKGPNMLAQ